ncbi:MAG: M6 family metalloprotease domain-containing protein [Sporocytophaga sp.]|nr:M6 family metalloprotease domain-containing protein [Sporocytophaga sp.]
MKQINTLKRQQGRSLSVIWLCLFLLVVPVFVNAYVIENRPVTVKQPDGKELHIFASGDGYYHWLHDDKNYTIVMDAQGFYVFAAVKDGLLVPTAYKVGYSNPASSGLVPGLNYSEENIVKIRNKRGGNIVHPSFMEGINEERAKNPNARFGAAAMNPIVLFIRFSGESEFSDAKSVYTDVFNSTTSPSLRGYYSWNSYNSLTINSTILGGTSTTIASYQDSHARSYFQPKTAANPNGYADDKARGSRENKLWEDAINSLKSKVPSTLNLDENGDGLIDMIFFVVKGSEDAWNDLLWPHAGGISSGTSIRINNKKPGSFMCVFESWHDVGLLCHETGHVLGAPDFYRYSPSPKITPLGSWDLMANQNAIPQSMSAYIKWKYMGFISSIPEIKESGWYTLKPLGEDKNAFKIRSSESGEFFVIEYRKKTTSSYESQISGSGLVIYRANSTLSGNGFGYPDELYVYRQGGIDSVTNGTLSRAFFSGQAGRTEFTDNTSPNAFMTDGSLGHLNITNISDAGNTITFYYERNCTNPTTVSTVTYSGSSTIPSLTATKTSIKTSGALTLAASSNKTFESKQITLTTGFTATANSNFRAKKYSCTLEKMPVVTRVLAQLAVTVDDDMSLNDISTSAGGLSFVPYPNPTEGEVRLISTGRDVTADAFILVYNNAGMLIQKIPVKDTLEELIVNLNGQPAGLYHINVVSGDQSVTRTVSIR